MSTDATTNEEAGTGPRPRLGSVSDAEEKLRAIAEAQGVVLDGKAWERVLAAGQDFFDSAEEHEQFIALLQQLRKQP